MVRLRRQIDESPLVYRSAEGLRKCPRSEWNTEKQEAAASPIFGPNRPRRRGQMAMGDVRKCVLSVVSHMSVTLIATAMLVAAGSRAGAAPSLGKTVTIETGTGEYADCLRKAFYEPFEKATGIKVLTAPENDDDSKFKLAVETHHYLADIEGVLNSGFAQAPNGPKYLEPIDYSVIPRSEIIPDLAQTYAVATDTYAYTLGYNTQKTGRKVPEGSADFFDLQKFPGKRGVGDGPTRILIMALLADGVAPNAI